MLKWIKQFPTFTRLSKKGCSKLTIKNNLFLQIFEQICQMNISRFLSKSRIVRSLQLVIHFVKLIITQKDSALLHSPGISGYSFSNLAATERLLAKLLH